MKTALYPRLAWDGLRKNKRLFTPYLLTCICMVMMFYILSFLGSPETCALLPRGSNSTGLILNLGSFVIFAFSAIFLYYTNSFLVRRREREFGLYNVLGMNKRNLARIVTWESLITAVLSLVLGLALGIVLSKLAELGLVNMLGGDINYRIRIDVDSLTRALGLYAVIFAVIWLSTVVRVGRSSAVALLRSESVGEKPPKANWLLGLAGVVILAAAYYLAVSITNPLDAIVWFFVAVILVIIGTYLLLVAGSVLLCRVLQKNKKYYYRPEHFVSVSSMAYRMKRNGAGLASVCIIATMILVMISSSSCLYFGAEDSANMRYPRDINITLAGETPEQITDGNIERYRRAIADYTSEMTLIVNDTASAVQDFRTYNGHVVTMQYKWVYNFNTDLGDEECVALTQGVMRTLGEVEPEQGYMYLLAECRADGSADFYGSNGALFFIGIMLTLVFMLAAVLILYYKQISEGYEDQKRFEIMQKVGMTKKEIRRSINSQLLTVFFLPLLLAGVHLAFAFPMIRRLLELFSLYNVGLFVTTTLVSFGAFALLYTIVYRLTAKAYYNIVSA